jgi:hypothetical protein
MDPRLAALAGLVARQQASGFPGLSGSEVQATIRISSEVLNEAIGATLGSVTAVRDLGVQPRVGNRFDVRVKLAKPAFLPTLNLGLAIERQPQFPADPVLVMKLTGAAGMIGFAGPAITGAGVLPPGIRLDGDRILVDMRILLQQYGQTALLDHVEQVQVMTEEGRLVLLVHARVRQSTT